MLHNNGNIIIVKGLEYQNRDGEIIKDKHGEYRGRPCIIISSIKGYYRVCSFQSQIVHRDNVFLTDPSMIYVYKEKLFSNYPGTIRMDWGRVSYLSIFNEFTKVAKMNSKPYLKFLQAFLNYHRQSNDELKNLILEDVKTQERVLSLKYNK